MMSHCLLTSHITVSDERSIAIEIIVLYLNNFLSDWFFFFLIVVKGAYTYYKICHLNRFWGMSWQSSS